MPADIAGPLADLELVPRDPGRIAMAVPDFDAVLTLALDAFDDGLTAAPGAAEPIAPELLAEFADHWRRLIVAGFDAAYDARVLQIGLAHRLGGIDPRRFLRGYGRFAARLIEETTRRSALDRDVLADLLSLLSRVVFLDLARMMHAYDVALVD